MSTTVEKCPTCKSDVLPRDGYLEAVAPDGDALNLKLHKVEKAIKAYYLALDQRQHGGVAQDQAFHEIQDALGMHWEQGKILSEVDGNPTLAHLYVKT